MENFDLYIKNKLTELTFKGEPDESQIADLFTRLDQADDAEAPVIDMPVRSRSFSLGRSAWRIAASVAILVAAGWVTYQSQNVMVQAERAEQLTHTLPDGSTVTLNAASDISYNKLAWRFGRRLNLEGEAFFEVEKGKAFSVKSEQGITEVLGTSFNVYTRENDYRVECFSGRVLVEVGDEQTQLAKGEGVRHRKTKKRFRLNPDQHGDWRSGQFYFDNDPLSQVVATLSRQFDIEVRLDKKYRQTRYTGYFTDQNQELALKLICDPLGLTYKLADGIVVIE